MYNTVSIQPNTNLLDQPSTFNTSSQFQPSDSLRREPSKNLSDINFNMELSSSMTFSKTSSTGPSLLGDSTSSLEQCIKALKILVNILL